MLIPLKALGRADQLRTLYPPGWLCACGARCSDAFTFCPGCGGPASAGTHPEPAAGAGKLEPIERDMKIGGLIGIAVLAASLIAWGAVRFNEPVPDGRDWPPVVAAPNPPVPAEKPFSDYNPARDGQTFPPTRTFPGIPEGDVAQAYHDSQAPQQQDRQNEPREQAPQEEPTPAASETTEPAQADLPPSEILRRP